MNSISPNESSFQQAISHAQQGHDLTEEQTSDLIDAMLQGAADEQQVADLLLALKAKGEAVSELVGAARAMRRHMTRIPHHHALLLDTCGTGGSGSNKFNVSTASAFVAAGAGIKVAKHGNRAASGKSGSADVLESAGVYLNLTPSQVAQCIDVVGLGFLFAVNHHGAMRHAIGPRKELQFRTVFNLLGPLTNPAGAENQVLGVFDRAWVRPMAEVLKKLGSQRVLVVHSEDGLDEISIAAPTRVAELVNGEISEYEIRPEDFGMKSQTWAGLTVQDSKESLTLVKAALSGEHDLASQFVTLNAGAAIYVGGGSQTLSGGIALAEDVIASGAATEKLRFLVEFSQQLGALSS